MNPGINPESRVALSFGAHSESSIGALDLLEKRLSELLKSQDFDQVVFFAERAHAPIEIALIFETLQKNQPPSDARITLDFFMRNSRKPTMNELARIKKKKRWDDPFTVAEFEMLDRLKKQFGTKLLASMEGMDQRIRARYEDTQNSDPFLPTHYLNTAVTAMNKGDIDYAAWHYRRSAELRGEYSRLREETMVARIVFALQTDKRVAVVANFGSTHTGILHELVKQGIQVSRITPAHESFLPYEVMVRRERFGKPTPDQDTLTWYQATLATILTSQMQDFIRQTGDDWPDDSPPIEEFILELVNSSFSNLADFQQLAMTIKKKGGLLEAFESQN